MAVSSIVVTLIGKPGCHLCDEARAVIGEIAARRGDVRLEERSILDDPALHERHWDEIPVVLVDGEIHTIWRVDPGRLDAAITAALAIGG